MLGDRDIFGSESELLDRLTRLSPEAMEDIALEITRSVLEATEGVAFNYPMRQEMRRLARQNQLASEFAPVSGALQEYLDDTEIDNVSTEEAKYFLQRLEFLDSPSSESLLRLLQTGFTVIDRKIWEEVVPKFSEPAAVEGKQYEEWFKATDKDPRIDLFLQRISHQLSEHLGEVPKETK